MVVSGVKVIERVAIVVLVYFCVQSLLLQHCCILHLFQAKLLHARVEVHHLLLECRAILHAMALHLRCVCANTRLERLGMHAQLGNLAAEESEVMLQVIIACAHANYLLDDVPQLTTEAGKGR